MLSDRCDVSAGREEFETTAIPIPNWDSQQMGFSQGEAVGRICASAGDVRRGVTRRVLAISNFCHSLVPEWD
jgi:hypothetical protein